MPELPEVETVKNGIAMKLTGAVIENITLRRSKLRWEIPVSLTKLAGGKIVSFDRRAKYLLINVEGGELDNPCNTIISHLGMSGRMTVFDVMPEMLEKHDHIIIETNQGVLVYNDARRFGMMGMAETDNVMEHRVLKDIGVEPLSDDFTGEHLQAILKGRKSNIKQAILNQKVVAGIGNIYVCEALFRSKISPLRVAGDLMNAEAALLVDNLKDVLLEAIASGGSTLRDYKQSNGSLGYFQHNFAVYGREGEECPNANCDAKIKRITQGGRSTFYCEKCQG
jgi:formamidopyrimidine-DNA glycosylase